MMYNPCNGWTPTEPGCGRGKAGGMGTEYYYGRGRGSRILGDIVSDIAEHGCGTANGYAAIDCTALGCGHARGRGRAECTGG